jgi:hypothetical protein
MFVLDRQIGECIIMFVLIFKKNMKATEQAGKAVALKTCIRVGAWFKYRLGHELSRLTYFVGFLSPSMHIPGQYFDYVTITSKSCVN